MVGQENILVLLLSKIRIAGSPGIEVQCQCLTVDDYGQANTVNLYFHFNESFGGELARVMTGLNIGGVYRIQGEPCWVDDHPESTYYYPDFQAIAANDIDLDVFSLLFNSVEEGQLYFYYSGYGDEWQITYRRNWLINRYPMARS